MMSRAMEPRALILFAHGSRDPAWCEPFRRLAAEVAARRTSDAVRLAFMEFASPALEEVVAELDRRGFRNIRLLPLFLAPGTHVARDIPLQVEEACRRHPAVRIEILRPAGEDPRFAELLAAMAVEALSPGPSGP
jgi:sirohydrochlorin cobaltochelatase